MPKQTSPLGLQWLAIRLGPCAAAAPAAGTQLAAARTTAAQVSGRGSTARAYGLLRARFEPLKKVRLRVVSRKRWPAATHPHPGLPALQAPGDGGRAGDRDQRAHARD